MTAVMICCCTKSKRLLLIAIEIAVEKEIEMMKSKTIKQFWLLDDFLSIICILAWPD